MQPAPADWPSEIARLVGTRIAALRHQRGWSQRALADRVGRTATQIGLWERGEYLPKLPALLELTEAYGLGSIEELLGDMLGSRRLIELRSDFPGGR